ncbi:Hypothetical predicted protein [Cloeon dipterum]|uniref:Uncharacterized protein n=1 Tax=Cloeon dipterum TaxID=197152 RepID=A0A8S1DE89_9INSE|nr:Hypothetical predicted protein [Cloeon dipterum]
MTGVGFTIPELRLPSQLSLNAQDVPRNLPTFHSGPSSLLALPHGATPRRRHSWICRIAMGELGGSGFGYVVQAA